LLRLVLATVFLIHGGGKLFGPVWFGGGGGIQGTTSYFESLGMTPGLLWAIVDGVAEFGAGLLLLVGLVVPLAAAVVVIDMLVAMLKSTLWKGFIVDKPGGGFELNLVLMVVAVAVGLLGAGPVSLDRVLGLTTGASRRRDT
jgi:putative oxidoreductase